MANYTTGNGDVGATLTPSFPIGIVLDDVRKQSTFTVAESEGIERLVSSGLPPIIRPEVLVGLLGISPKLLFAMAHVPRRYYRVFEIPKRNGDARRISTPRVYLKVVQTWILRNILQRIKLPDYVTGFVAGRGTVSNGLFHVGKNYLLRLDIQDFFPSIGYGQVFHVYSGLGYPEKVAQLFSRLCLLDDRLPQGAPTSPQLANLVFHPIDLRISRLAKREGMTYSRYADDLTFSSENPIGVDFVQGIDDLISRNRLRLRREKVFLAGPGRRLWTAGMVVNVKVHPQRKIRRQLRARFHQARLHPERFAKEASRLLGWAAYVNMYDRETGNSYLAIARRVAQLAKYGN